MKTGATKSEACEFSQAFGSFARWQQVAGSFHFSQETFTRMPNYPENP